LQATRQSGTKSAEAMQIMLQITRCEASRIALRKIVAKIDDAAVG
jgi:hypothetical protein